MVNDGIGKRIVQSLAAVWLVAGLVLCRFDISQGTLTYYDALRMAPFLAIHLAIFCGLIVVSLRLGRYSVFDVLLVALYAPMIVLANYPLLTFRDVYSHGAPVEVIISLGRLGHLQNPEPNFWPLTYILHAMLAVLLGCDVVNSNYILYLALSVALALATYVIARTMKANGYMLAWATGILFFALFTNHLFQFNYFARNPFALVLTVLFLAAFIRLSSRPGLLIQVPLLIAIVTTHPFNSLYVTILLFAYAVMTSIIRTAGLQKKYAIAIFSGVMFLGWWMYNALPNFRTGLRMFMEVAFSTRYLEPVVTITESSQTVPLWGLVLRDYYKYSLLGLMCVALLGVLTVTSRKWLSKTRMEVSLGAITIASGMFVFILLAMPEYSLYRATTFLAIPAGFSSIIIAERLLRDRKMPKHGPKFRYRIGDVLAVGLIVSLLFTATMLHYENNIYYGEMEHRSEISFLKFTFTNVPNRATIATSWKVSVYATYFDPNSTHPILLYVDVWNAIYGRGEEPVLLSNVGEVVEGSDVLLRGSRDVYLLTDPLSIDPSLKMTANALNSIDSRATSEQFNKVSANGYYSLYSRVS